MSNCVMGKADLSFSCLRIILKSQSVEGEKKDSCHGRATLRPHTHHSSIVMLEIVPLLTSQCSDSFLRSQLREELRIRLG
jgi:hypothetical protein